MKLIMTTAAAALISTAAVAENSSRYNDIFLDTSVGAEEVYGNNTRMQDADRSVKANDIRLNTADMDKNCGYRAEQPQHIAQPR